MTVSRLFVARAHGIMRRIGRAPIIVLVAVLLAACGGEPSAEGAPTRVPLPTVTPVPPPTPTGEALPTSSATPMSAPSVEPTTSAGPAEAVASPTGAAPVTASMAQLKIDGEPYAALGDPSAPVTVVEFSDYGCPFCRIYELTTFPELKTRYIDTGKVYYVYKDYPIVSEQGGLAAEAAFCAGEQGKYWEMHQKLFVTPKEWNVAPELAHPIFARYAQGIGIDGATLEQCITSGRATQEVDRDFEQGLALGLQGTPAFIINGKLLNGAQSLEIFVKVLEGALNEP